MFVDTLVSRTKIDVTVPLSASLARVREAGAGAFGPVELPFEQLVAAINRLRSPQRVPVFQVRLASATPRTSHSNSPI